MEFRTLKNKEDFEKIVILDSQIFPLKDCISVEEYLNWVEEGLECNLLVDSNNNWIGYYQMHGNSYEHKYLAGISIFREYQGKKYAHILFRDILKKYGNLIIISKIREDNLRSKNLHYEYGFEPYKEEIIDGDLWIWYKRMAT